MRQGLLIAMIVNFGIIQLEAQLTTGYVRDSLTREALIGAYIECDGSYAITNDQGYFSMSSVGQCDTLTVSFAGYSDVRIGLGEDTYLDILISSGIWLDEVRVSGGRRRMELAESIERLSLDVDQIKSIPTFLGESDFMKGIATTPGVSTGYQGSTGLFVRGGTPDQNLITLDGANIYNGAHLMGFVSMINPDVIKSWSLYKGGIPSEYGGRLSSVLDIEMKDGNKKSINRELTIGLLTSKYLHEQPYGDGRGSILVAGRMSYLSLLASPLYFRYKAGKTKSYDNYWMYDLNVKTNYQLSARTQIDVCYFRGRDIFVNKRDRDEKESYNHQKWGNETASLQLSMALGAKGYWTTNVNYNAYRATNEDNGQLGNQNVNGIVRSGITGLGVKTIYHWMPHQLVEVKSGVELRRESFNPSVIEYFDSPDVDLWGRPRLSNSQSAFVSGDLSTLGGAIVLSPGVRLTRYSIGSDYDALYLEPRISTMISMGEKRMMRLAYDRLYQTTNLLASHGLAQSTDFWMPSIEEYPISSVHSWSLEYAQHLTGDLRLRVGAFHKDFAQLTSLREGIDYYDIELPVAQKIQSGGRGRAYGAEVMIHQRRGALSGWLSYDWSKNQRRFDNINSGRWYDYKYDRRHNFNLVLNYALARDWTMSSNFTYSTGVAYTSPQHYYYDGQWVRGYYQQRNNARYPAYHALDLSFTREREKSRLTVGVNNVYARLNPISQRERTRSIDIHGEPHWQLGIERTGIRVPIPFISYTFLFDKK